MRTGALTAGSVAIALVLSACGGGDTKTTDNGGATKGASGFNAATNGIVNPSTKKGGTLKLAIYSDIDSWDTTRTYLGTVWNFSRSFYARSLLTNDTKPGKDGLTLVPDLATALPEITDGGKTYTLKLKKNVKFEDGSPITSKDIKYGIERDFAQDVLSGGPVYLKDELDQGQNYPGPYKDTDPDKLGLKTVETPDDSTIIFRLKQPNADFSYLLAEPAASPVPKGKDTGEKYSSHVVASGPYMFETVDPGKKVTMVRNPSWDPATDPTRKALVDRIELTIGTSPDEIDNELLAGDIDGDLAGTGVQPGAQSKILLDPEKKKNADTPITGAIRYFAISHSVVPFDNVHCRKAVQYATDKVAMQTARGGSEAGGDIAINMLPPVIAGHDPAYDPYQTKSGKPQIDKAKEELTACGKPNGFETTIATRNAGKELKTAEALQQALAQVGIKAKLDQRDPSLYFRSDIGVPTNVKNKGYGLMLAGWSADYPTPTGFLRVLVDGRLILPSGNSNYSEINSPAINDLIDKSANEPDAKKNADIWANINKLVMEDAALVPFTYDKALNYRNARLTNVFYNEYYGYIDWASVGVQA